MIHKSSILTTGIISFFLLSLISCSNRSELKVSGSVDYLGNARFYMEFPVLHYKYSPKNQIDLNTNNGNFNITISDTLSGISYIHIQDVFYPIYIASGADVEITIKRADFPNNVSVTGAGADANAAYQSYLSETSGLQANIDAEMDKFKEGLKNNALELSEKKLATADQFLKNTDFHDLYLKVLGEDLILKLRAVEYSARHNSDFDADAARKKVIDEALEKNFFSFETLQVQRAGIRDFTHYYSRTFGIYDSVKTIYGDDLAEYDIKRLAYPSLNEKRMQVINFISEPKAKAYAELFLVAERIGELPLEWAEPSYKEYLQTYTNYPEYIEFITWFYEEIKSVSPGEPAIPFTLYDRAGNAHSMEEYRGKFVLLDFWAGWCQPCLEEFPNMRDIYKSYSRDELEILGISTEIDSLTWIYDIERFENPWPQFYGGNGFNQETFKAYKGGGIPFYILIDPDGNISRYNDVRPSFNFTEVLDSLLLENNSN